MVRRHVLVRRLKIVGLGKEANRIEAGRVLGQAAVGGRAKTYVDWKGRLLAMGRGEAKRLGLSWDSVKRAKRTLRRTGTLRDGHGGRFVTRLKVAWEEGTLGGQALLGLKRAVGDRSGIPNPASSQSPQRSSEQWSTDDHPEEKSADAPEKAPNQGVLTPHFSHRRKPPTISPDDSLRILKLDLPVAR